jgi:hypothetical protein
VQHIKFGVPCTCARPWALLLGFFNECEFVVVVVVVIIIIMIIVAIVIMMMIIIIIIIIVIIIITTIIIIIIIIGKDTISFMHGIYTYIP